MLHVRHQPRRRGVSLHADPGVRLALGDRASSLDSGSWSERAVFSGGGISSGRSELARWPFFSGGGSERADFSEQNHTQNRKIFPACGPQVGPQAKLFFSSGGKTS